MLYFWFLSLYLLSVNFFLVVFFCVKISIFTMADQIGRDPENDSKSEENVKEVCNYEIII